MNRAREEGKAGRQVQEEPLEPDLPICDAHYHFWERPSGRYMLEDFLGDVAGAGHHVVQTVYSECRSMYRTSGIEEMRPVGETEGVCSIVEQLSSNSQLQPKVASGIVGYADLRLGARAEPVLEAHLAAGKGRFRGIRNVSTWHNNPEVALPAHNTKSLLADSAFRRGFALLKKFDLSFDACLFFPQLPELLDLARAFPETPIILDHAGGILGIGPYAGKSDEVLRAWKKEIEGLASCPNVFVKFGGLGQPNAGFGWHKRPIPPDSIEISEAIAPYLSWCIEQFGAHRCMFESNFPVDRVSYSYSTIWNAFKLVTEHFSPSERSALFHDTATEVYQLSAPRDQSLGA